MLFPKLFAKATPAKPPPADDALIAMWLHGVAPRTRETYAIAIRKLRAALVAPLAEASVADLQRFTDGLAGAPATLAKTLAAVKSYYRFCCKAGIYAFNPAACLRCPTIRRRFGDRFLNEGEIHLIIESEDDDRNRLLLETLYTTGLRVSELASITWGDVVPRQDLGAAQVRVMGKGSKERNVPFPYELWQRLAALRHDAPATAPIFVSRKGGALARSQVMRIVRDAARRAGLERKVSPHWFRHAHATHALAHGAPLHVVQQTLGHATLSITGLYLHARPMESSAMFLNNNNGKEKPSR